MDKAIIYGVLNEDRRIVFITDLQSTDWDPDYWFEDDAEWKRIKLNNYNFFNEVDNIEYDKNIVILEQVEKDENVIEDRVTEWIDMIKPKYILDYISPADLMDFRIRQERGR